MDDVTQEMNFEAARNIQRRKGWFTGRDLWYEQGNVTTRGRTYDSYDFRAMNRILKSIHAVKLSATDHNGRTKYILPEE